MALVGRGSKSLGVGIVLLGMLQGCGIVGDDTPSDLGDPCVPNAEWRVDYSGAAVSEVGVDPNSPFCTEAGSVCLTNHFRGRVACPYGQNAPPNSTLAPGENALALGVTHAEHCSIPSQDDLIQVPVEPQLHARSPEKSVYCSCRCAGPDPNGDYCECGDGFVCQDLIDNLGFNAGSAGSYCVKSGTEVNNPTTIPLTPCRYDDQDCGDEVSVSGLPADVSPQSPRTSFVDRINAGVAAKLDLLLVVDNSPGMLDKQRLFAESIPRLIEGLTHPPCIDAASNVIAQSSAGGCPADSAPQFAAITDLNVGVITSSMGSVGATSGTCNNSVESAQREDMAHLLGSLPRGVAAVAGNALLDAAGFLSWRSEGDAAAFSSVAQELVMSAGDLGCPYEGTLESWYRFLIDPEPYLQLAPVSCGAGGTDTNCRAPNGLDQTVLDQRAAFLRPDSFVSVVVLSDENDCSVKASGQAWYVLQDNDSSPMWRAAEFCEEDPNNACCYSCGQTPPAGCAAAVNCGDANNTREPSDYYVDVEGLRDTLADPSTLRCFQQKRRFGVDFLYPTQRYSNALAQRELCVTRNDLSTADCGSGRILPNPLYWSNDGDVAVDRDPSQVFLSAVVGVPWQDIVRDPIAGVLTYKTFAELQADQVWPLILGDGITPGDPLMQESVQARLGTSPVVGAPLAAPNSADPWTNPINGHEWTNTLGDGLQIACAYPLPAPIDCTIALPGTCDCTGVDAEQDNRPQCQAADGSYGTSQHAGVAYPGLRQLQVAKEYGTLTTNALVASICPRNASDPSASDFGYQSAMDALVRSVGEQNGPRCLPRPLPVNNSEGASCLLVSVAPSGNDCDCDRPGRAELPAGVSRNWIDEALQQNGICSGSTCASLCACAIPQLEGDELQGCQNIPASTGDGWCYVDTTGDLEIGSPDLVSRCPSTAKRMLRFSGASLPESEATVLINCSSP